MKQNATTPAYPLLILGAFLVICQYVLAPVFPLFSGHINFFLIFVFMLSIFRKQASSIVIACFLGILYDLSTTGPVGTSALFFSIGAFLLIRLDTSLVQASIREILLRFVVFSATYELIYLIVASLFLGAISLFSLVILTFLPSVLLDVFAFVLIWALFRRFSGGLGQGVNEANFPNPYKLGTPKHGRLGK